MQQLLLFNVENDKNKDFNELKNEWEKTRKSLYARLSENNKKYTELHHEFEILKMNLCKGKIIL